MADFDGKIDAIVYEWYKSPEFSMYSDVQWCPDDLEFLGGNAIGFMSI